MPHCIVYASEVTVNPSLARIVRTLPPRIVTVGGGAAAVAVMFVLIARTAHTPRKLHTLICMLYCLPGFSMLLLTTSMEDMANWLVNVLPNCDEAIPSLRTRNEELVHFLPRLPVEYDKSICNQLQFLMIVLYCTESTGAGKSTGGSNETSPTNRRVRGQLV